MKRFLFLLVLALFVLVSGLSTGFPLYYRLFVLLVLVLGAGLAWSYFSLRWVRLTFERPAKRVQVGDSVETRVAVNNTGPIPMLGVEVWDLLDLPGGGSGKVVHLGAGKTKEIVLRGSATRRGIYTLKGPALVSVDPLGVLRRSRRAPGTAELVVVPAVQPIPDFVTSYVDLLGEEGSHSRAHTTGGAISSVREYLPGDNYKYVHWKTTARTGELMVKQFDAGKERRMWVLLDLHREVQAGQPPHSTEECAVTLAASVVNRYVGLEWSVGVAGTGDAHYAMWPQSGPSALEEALRMLASVRGEGTVPLSTALGAMVDMVSSPPGTVVLITPSTDPSWGSQLAALSRFGNSILVLLIDAASFGGASEVGPLAFALRAARVPTYVIRKGISLGKQFVTGTTPWQDPEAEVTGKRL